MGILGLIEADRPGYITGGVNVYYKDGACTGTLKTGNGRQGNGRRKTEDGKW